MRDENQRQPELALELEQQRGDLGLDRNIQRGQRLIADDQFGLDDQRTRDADALRLAARELVWIALQVLRLKSDPCEHGEHALASRVVRQLGFKDLQWLFERGADALARIERRDAILKDHLQSRARAL